MNFGFVRRDDRWSHVELEYEERPDGRDTYELRVWRAFATELLTRDRLRRPVGPATLAT